MFGAYTWGYWGEGEQLLSEFSPLIYLKTSPCFIRGTNWPIFGPDVERDNKLPAQIRFEKGNPIQ